MVTISLIHFLIVTVVIYAGYAEAKKCDFCNSINDGSGDLESIETCAFQKRITMRCLLFENIRAL